MTRAMNRAAIRLSGTLALTGLLASGAAAQGWVVEAVALQGEVAPGTAGGTYSGFSSNVGIPAELDDSGSVYFIATIVGGDTIGIIARGTSGGAVPLIRRGDAAPGGGTYGVLSSFAASGSGLLAFATSTPLIHLFLDDGVTESRIVESGAPSPAGGTLSPGSRPDVNDSATIAFWAFEGGVAPVSEGIFTTAGGLVTAIARNNSVGAPDTGGATYTFFRRLPTLNDAGDVVFTALLSGGTSTEGIFRHDAALSSVVKVALLGEAAPDTGGTFSAFSPSPVALHEDGTVTFRAVVAGGSVTEGIFAVELGSPVSRVLPGDTAPGTGGDTYSSFGPSPTVSKSGSAAFAATTVSAVDGYFVQTASSEAAIALEGDAAPGGGTLRPINSNRPDVNNALTAAFYSPITGGTALTGIFVATPPVPSVPLLPWPALGALLLLLGGVVVHRASQS